MSNLAATQLYLWVFYKVAPLPISKTYARDDTSHAANGVRMTATTLGRSMGHVSPARKQMLDALMLGLAAAFFALAVGYTFLCDRL